MVVRGEARQTRWFQRRFRRPDARDKRPPALPLQSVKCHPQWCRRLLERPIYLQGTPLDITDIWS